MDDDDDYNPLTCKEFLVYQDYKLQLKGYSKKQFDPFVEDLELIFITMIKNRL